MSYTYLQEQGEESSAASFADIPQFVLSRLNLTAEKSCCNGKGTECCQSSRSGTMCEHSKESHGEGRSMSSAEDSHALICQQQASEPLTGSMESGQGYGLKWPASSAKYNRDTCLWKIHPCLFPEDSIECFPTLPRCGSMRNGNLSERVASVPIIHDCGRGFWPTPKAADYKGAVAKDAAAKARSRGFNPNLPELVAEMEGGGQLNPEFHEWLMGWPIGWTALKPLAMDKYRQWLHSHGEYLAENE